MMEGAAALNLSQFTTAGTDPELAVMITKARAGVLPLSRPLADHEPQKLDDAHVQMIFLKHIGVPQRRIAEIFNYTESRVSILMNHPYAVAILTKLLTLSAAQSLDIGARLDALLPKAVESLGEVLEDPQEKGAVKSRVAFGLLDRRGYGETKKVKTTHELQMPKEHSKLLVEALKESQDISELSYAQFTDVTEENAGSETPEAHGAEGSPESPPSGAGTPPVSGSQSLLPPDAGP